MNKEAVKQFLIEKKGYLKKSALEVAKVLWKNSNKYTLSKHTEQLKKEIKQISEIQSALRKAQKFETNIHDNILLDAYNQIIEEKNKPKRILFFDIETSFNQVCSWQIGRKINLSPENILVERKIITICYKFSDSDKVHSLTWDNNQNDKKMLERFSKIMDSADIICGHNSDAFDTKHIRTRCMYHSISLSPKYNSIDTLKLARSGFKMNSNKLDYIGQYLGEGQKIDTGGLQLWKDVILKKDKKALNTMINYCCGDVLLLEKVYKRLQKFSSSKKFKFSI